MRTTFALIITLAAIACNSSHTPTDNELRPVKYVVAKHIKYVERDFAALTTADDASNLAFKIGGRIADIPVAKGQYVDKGELLAELDKRDVELQVEAAKAAYDDALSRLNRAERLYEHDAISLQEVESLRNSVTQLRSTYENSLDLLADTRLTAPFSGVVERTYADAFQRVASGETVVRLVNPISTTVGFTVPESIVNSLALPTTEFSVEFDAFPNVRFPAVIKSFARTSSDALGFPVSIRLIDVDTEQYSISPGMTCVATILTPESNPRALTLPLSAIYAPGTGGNYVWIIKDDGRVEQREVSLGGLSGDDNVIILSGIEAGDRIVTAGIYKLRNGEKVRIIE